MIDWLVDCLRGIVVARVAVRTSQKSVKVLIDGHRVRIGVSRRLVEIHIDARESHFTTSDLHNFLSSSFDPESNNVSHIRRKRHVGMTTIMDVSKYNTGTCLQSLAHLFGPGPSS